MIRPPVIPSAPVIYDAGVFERLFSELRTYFVRANNPYPVNASTLNINTNTLPTQAALATLSTGDVYVDTTAGNVLKVKL
jgi:hypothetical protein